MEGFLLLLPFKCHASSSFVPPISEPYREVDPGKGFSLIYQCKLSQQGSEPEGSGPGQKQRKL